MQTRLRNVFCNQQNSEEQQELSTIQQADEQQAQIEQVREQQEIIEQIQEEPEMIEQIQEESEIIEQIQEAPEMFERIQEQKVQVEQKVLTQKQSSDESKTMNLHGLEDFFLLDIIGSVSKFKFIDFLKLIIIHFV